MKKSKQEAAQTRVRIVKTAAAAFRQNGIRGTGLAELMSAAGLTHGGFYRHFDSKDQLIAEASADALDARVEEMVCATAKTRRQKGLGALVQNYLSVSHRDNRQNGCVFAALGSELARADHNARKAATLAFEKMVQIISGQFTGMKPTDAKKRATAALSTMVGALTLARVVEDKELSKAILADAANLILHLGPDSNRAR